MPERGMGGGGALTPLAQAYDIDSQGYQSLLGAVQERIRLRQQARMLDEELERRKELTTFKLEEQDRLRREFYYDIEQPQLEARATQQEIEARIEAEKEINERIDRSRREVNNFMSNRRRMSTLPLFSIPTEFGFTEDMGVVLQNPMTGETMTPQQYQSFVAEFDGVETFLNDYFNNATLISDDEVEMVDGIQYLNSTQARNTVAKLSTQSFSDDPEKRQAEVHEMRTLLEDISVGNIRLNIPGNREELRASQERKKELNRLYSEILSTQQWMTEGDATGFEIDNRGWLRRRGQIYKFDLKNQTYGEFNREVERYIEDQGNRIDPETDPVVILRNQVRTMFNLAHETLQPRDPNRVRLNFSRERVDDPSQIFIPTTERSNQFQTDDWIDPTSNLLNSMGVWNN